MGQNTLSLPKARLNGSGVVRKPDGQIRQDEIYEELKKEDNDGSQPRLDDPNRPVQHSS